MNLEKLKYPIGQFIVPEKYTEEFIEKAINDIESFPKRLKNAVVNLSQSELNTPYRPEGWTVRQLIHHCADSHMNAYIRFKLALTEKESPTINPYEEAIWAELPDSKLPIETSLVLLESLHQRWSTLLRSLSETDLEKGYIHPANNHKYSLNEAIGTYQWHSNHHLAHIVNLIERNFEN